MFSLDFWVLKFPISDFSKHFSLFQCIHITYMDTCLRPFESDMPNLERESWVPLGRVVFPTFSCLASPPIVQLSPLLRTSAIQRPILAFELLRVLIGCARCCKGDSSLSLPVHPSAPSSLVLVVSCSCSPGPGCGFLPGSNLSTCSRPNQSSSVITSSATQMSVDVKKD